MQNKRLRVIWVMLLVISVLICLKQSVCQKTNWEILKMENVEALTSSEEENPDYPCVKAKGYCYIDGIIKGGITLVDK